MQRIFAITLLLASLTLGFATGPASAQDVGIDPAFSSELITTLGLPEVAVEAVEGGFTTPAETVSGPTLVTLSALEGFSSYVAFMQPAPGLSTEEATELALLTARDDIFQDGWTYAGGSYAIDGSTVKFAVNLAEGDWQIAASYQQDGGEEVMTLYPLTVAGEGPPIADPAVTTIELNDTAFIGAESPLVSGPQLLQIQNIGTQPRQLVLFRSPTEITVDDYLALFGINAQGTPAASTPAAGVDFMSQMEWVGYAAILSPGQIMWLELDLEPGIYTQTSWVVDPATGAPAVILGMVTNFEVVAG